MRLAVAALLLALQGCGLTTYSRTHLAEEHREICEGIYCSGYGTEERPMIACPNIEDLVVICIEDYEDDARAQLNWFGRFLLTLAEALP